MIDVDVNPSFNEIDLSIQTDDLSCDLVIDINAVEIDINVSPGMLGEQGPEGPQGPPGLDGLDGINGTNGIDGQDGQDGADGLPGQDGQDGANGTDGVDGQDGESAYQIALDNGFVGTETEWLESIKGEQGVVGQNGSDGVDGNDGVDGIDGSQGPKGDTGDTGSQGIQGLQGEKGDTGDTGADGLPGADGVDGTNGIDGVDGAQGVQGDQGIQGVPGTDGTDGTNGTNGTDGSDGLSAYEIWINNGNTGTEQDFLDSLEGDQGIPGVNGTDGVDGAPGQDGTDGQDGADGADGPTVVSTDPDNTATLGTDGFIFVPEGISGGLSEDEVTAIAAGSTLGLDQSLLANAGQPGKTVLAVGFTDTGKVQGVSLGNGNVVEVYANGTDFNAGTVLYREFMGLGEPICFTGLANGAIITSSQGFYGFSEQLNGANESPMPLLSYGLSFKETFLFAFRDSNDNNTNRGFIRVVNGPLKSLVSLTRGDGTPVNSESGAGTPQTDIEVGPWGFLTLQTDANTEFIIKSTNFVMACVHAEMRATDPRYHDSRLIMPLTNDGITWPRSGNVSAPYDNTLVNYYVRDGATGSFVVSPGAPIDFDSGAGTGASDQDYEPDGATRVLAVGLISAYSGADSAGLEASPLMPTIAMSQVIAQPLFIADNGDGGNSGVAISSPYEGTAKVYSWNDVTKTIDLIYTVPLNRNIGGTATRNDQNFPSAGLVANETVTGTVLLVGQLNPGIVIADVPVTVVVQNGDSNLSPTLRSQNGTTTTSIINDDDETLSLGITPPTLKADITEGADGLLYKRVITAGVVSYVLA